MTDDEKFKLERENRQIALRIAQDKIIVPKAGLYSGANRGFNNVRDLITDAKEIEKYLNEE